jgi:drug/metabolite transporter (DMT)-like permease
VDVKMRRFYIAGFLLLLVFDTAGQMGFKLAAASAGFLRLDWQWLAMIFTSTWIYVAVGAYVGAFFVWMTILEHAPIGPAFAASHLEIVSVLVLSVVLLGESLSLSQIVGGCLVFAGIAVLAAGETRGEVGQGEP